ncbi:hypothetical protein [Oceanobacillus chungangensis]|uniref:Uncharacterized protein n=1 Tax=Oceanobacillus chungangensis TaxID=1229152 RepID=A0A3D8PPY9_9BACI|nr:hypothetical protein [Oceanobacillus chungangensis]RDW17318.1 hypothetical protein CWR45_13080 [Oceanobacillus chungangensis]
MKYFKISTVLFLISLCLLLVGLFSEKMKFGYIVVGLIVNYIGIAMLMVGAFKRYKTNNKKDM